MDMQRLIVGAREVVEPAAWAYIQGTAGADGVDQQAWSSLHLVPGVLRGVRSADTRTTLAGSAVAAPIMIAPTAGHRLAHPDGECASAIGAAAAGALMIYSSSAAMDVTTFGAAATGPWWAQVYVMVDRGVTDDYLDRCVAAGANAPVLTVDYPGAVANAQFRATSQAVIDARPGNYPQWTWQQMTASIDPAITPDVIAELAELAGLPVHVKGVLQPRDAATVVAAGAAGVMVSNHGRRQVEGVLPTAYALADIVAAVAGSAQVTVDGGIRSGTDVLRALALGAAGVGVGRPVLWGLATGGSAGVRDIIGTLTAELRQAMVSVGAGTLADIDASCVRWAPR